jgi:hypothetical protein
MFANVPSMFVGRSSASPTSAIQPGCHLRFEKSMPTMGVLVAGAARREPQGMLADRSRSGPRSGMNGEPRR